MDSNDDLSTEFDSVYLSDSKERESVRTKQQKQEMQMSSELVEEIGKKLLEAAGDGDSQIVRELLRPAGVLEQLEPCDKQIALSQASKEGHVEVVNLLLEAKSIDKVTICWSVENALYDASKGGYIDVVKLLLETKPID
eukprot:956147_1